MHICISHTGLPLRMCFTIFPEDCVLKQLSVKYMGMHSEKRDICCNMTAASVNHSLSNVLFMYIVDEQTQRK